jgi:hypothetical protein
VPRLLAQGVSLERVVYLDTGDEDDGTPELTEVGALQYTFRSKRRLCIFIIDRGVGIEAGGPWVYST